MVGRWEFESNEQGSGKGGVAAVGEWLVNKKKGVKTICGSMYVRKISHSSWLRLEAAGRSQKRAMN
jgi:hypothetical protein